MQRVRLIGRTGIYLNAEFEVTGEIIFGRDAKLCQVVYPEKQRKISGVHCKVTNMNGQVCLIDLKSTNGTYLLDGTRLEPDMPRTMTNGQGFYLGSREEAFDILIEDAQDVEENGNNQVSNGGFGFKKKQKVRDNNAQDYGKGENAVGAKDSVVSGHAAGTCPMCGCTNCQVISETTSKGKDFSFGKACCCSLVLGPFGILCGACGKGKKIETESYWVCPQCGNKFKV